MALAAKKHDVIGLLLGAFGAAFFSLKGIILKLSFMEGANVEQMMALRMSGALPVFVLVGWLAHRRRKTSLTVGQIVQAAGLGILSYYVCSWLDFTGLQYISAQLERLILFTYPTLTAIFAAIFLKDRITARHGLALAFSYAGVAVLFGRELASFGPQASMGAGLVFTSAVLFAAYVTASKRVISAMGPALFTSISMGAASIAILTHFSIQSAFKGMPGMSASIWLYGGVLALLCTVAPSFMMSAAIGRIGPGLASAVGGFGPAATAAAAVLILSEPFGMPQALSLVLTVGGVMLLAFGAHSSPAMEPPGRPAHER